MRSPTARDAAEGLADKDRVRLTDEALRRLSDLYDAWVRREPGVMRAQARQDVARAIDALAAAAFAEGHEAALRSAGTEGGETQGAAEMREAAKVACLDLADAYREASEAHMASRTETKAREAMDWAIGAMECAHAVAKLHARTTDGGEA